MGKRGPAPKPTSLKVLQGNPGKRPINQDEPKPKPIAPKPPTWLPKEAKKIWKQLAPKLEPLALLTEIDFLNFQNLCLAAARVKAMEQALAEHGEVMEIERYDKDGNVLSTYYQQRPEVSILHKNVELVNKLGAKFGLSPADRVGLGVKPKKEQVDPFEEFLNRGKKA